MGASTEFSDPLLKKQTGGTEQNSQILFIIFLPFCSLAPVCCGQETYIVLTGMECICQVDHMKAGTNPDATDVLQASRLCYLYK